MPFNSYPFLLEFPETLMRERTIVWELAARTISGGRTFSGAMPLARADGGGLWSAELRGVQVSSADHVRAWRALASRLDGGATPVVMSVRDERFAPWPASGTARYESENSDGSVCSDGTGYVSDRILASVASAAALRATTLTITIDNGVDLRGGEYFSIQHPEHSHRLYRVGQVTVNGDGDQVCVIRPPLREAVEAGTRAEFDFPKCVMQLASPDAMDLALERRMFGSADVKFIECFPPFDA